MRAMLAIGLLLALPAGAAQAEELELGAWCWESSDAEATPRSATVILRSDTGQYMMVQKTEGSADLTYLLKSVGSNEYGVVGSPSGDGLIIRADGMLEIYDSSGTLGAAEPRALSECLKGNPQ
ncbi:hypothetical protein [Hyphomonas sp.]|uniref:hypothetical protein n=1 Tax=Hyphomonas sp. TaxID=87 RepID=UPI003528C3B9